MQYWKLACPPGALKDRGRLAKKFFIVIQQLIDDWLKLTGESSQLVEMLPKVIKEPIDTADKVIERIKTAYHAHCKSRTEEERVNMHVLLTYLAPPACEAYGEMGKVAMILEVSRASGSMFQQAIERRKSFDEAEKLKYVLLGVGDVMDCRHGLGSITALDDALRQRLILGLISRHMTLLVISDCVLIRNLLYFFSIICLGNGRGGIRASPQDSF
jgi:hypothetical protein